MRTLRILVVHRSPTMIEKIIGALREEPSYRISRCAGAGQALTLLHRHTPRLVIVEECPTPFTPLEFLNRVSAACGASCPGFLFLAQDPGDERMRPLTGPERMVICATPLSPNVLRDAVRRLLQADRLRRHPRSPTNRLEARLKTAGGDLLMRVVDLSASGFLGEFAYDGSALGLVGDHVVTLMLQDSRGSDLSLDLPVQFRRLTVHAAESQPPMAQVAWEFGRSDDRRLDLLSQAMREAGPSGEESSAATHPEAHGERDEKNRARTKADAVESGKGPKSD